MADGGLNATAASLLGFLKDGPLSGYDLAEEIDASVGQFWNTTQSQIYRELADLEKSGLIRGGPPQTRRRRSYEITPAGRDAFRAWIARQPGEGVTRLPMLLTVFFADDIPPQRFRSLLQTYRAYYEAMLEDYRKRLPSIEDQWPYQAETMRFGIEFAEMAIGWIDRVSARSLG